MCLHSQDSGQDTDSGQRAAGTASGGRRGGTERAQLQAVAPCRGKAEEKPLDSAETVTGAQGRGLIVVVDVGIFAGVIGIIAIITGVAMLDSERRV